MHILWGSHAAEQQKDSLKSFRPELIAAKCIFVYVCMDGCTCILAAFLFYFFNLCVYGFVFPGFARPPVWSWES